MLNLGKAIWPSLTTLFHNQTFTGFRDTTNFPQILLFGFDTEKTREHDKIFTACLTFIREETHLSPLGGNCNWFPTGLICTVTIKGSAHYEPFKVGLKSWAAITLTLKQVKQSINQSIKRRCCHPKTLLQVLIS